VAQATPLPGPRPSQAWRQPGDRLRYGQCWEDADCLLAALDPQPGQVCLSIASGGENSLALLTRDPARVIALDISPAQTAALELKMAAFRSLAHGELLVLLGAWDAPEGPAEDRRPHGGPLAPVPRPLRQHRLALYHRCRPLLSPAARGFWDRQGQALGAGLLSLGRFERYLALFRHGILPLVHRPERWHGLLEPATRQQRQHWYEHRWDGWRWRLLFRAFFSRRLLGYLGTDPSCLRYGEAPLADLLLERLRHALVDQDPATNPYLHWILLGRFGSVLPCALRPENFAPIRARLDRLQLHTIDLQGWLAAGSGSAGESGGPGIDRFNLSNVFEYLSPQATEQLLQRLHARAGAAARLVCWNRLAERGPQRSPLAGWRPLAGAAAALHASDRVFFYRRLVLAEATGAPAAAAGVASLASGSPSPHG